MITTLRPTSMVSTLASASVKVSLSTGVLSQSSTVRNATSLAKLMADSSTSSK